MRRSSGRRAEKKRRYRVHLKRGRRVVEDDNSNNVRSVKMHHISSVFRASSGQLGNEMSFTAYC